MEKKQVLIYTDGGWGAVLITVDSGKEKYLSGFEMHSTNNRMELMAAIMALTELKRPCNVTLRTDSSYLKKAFTDSWLDKKATVPAATTTAATNWSSKPAAAPAATRWGDAPVTRADAITLYTINDCVETGNCVRMSRGSDNAR